MLKSLGKKIASIVLVLTFQMYVCMCVCLIDYWMVIYTPRNYIKLFLILVQMTNAPLKEYTIFNQSPTAGHFSFF